jgi:hypothetical protein
MGGGKASAKAKPGLGVIFSKFDETVQANMANS